MTSSQIINISIFEIEIHLLQHLLIYNLYKNRIKIHSHFYPYFHQDGLCRKKRNTSLYLSPVFFPDENLMYYQNKIPIYIYKCINHIQNYISVYLFKTTDYLYLRIYSLLKNHSIFFMDAFRSELSFNKSEQETKK